MKTTFFLCIIITTLTYSCHRIDTQYTTIIREVLEELARKAQTLEDQLADPKRPSPNQRRMLEELLYRVHNSMNDCQNMLEDAQRKQARRAQRLGN